MAEAPHLSPLLRERLAALGQRLSNQLSAGAARRYLLEFEALLAAAASGAAEERETFTGFVRAMQDQLEKTQVEICKIRELCGQSEDEAAAFDGQMKILVAGMREELLAGQCPAPLEEGLHRALVLLEGGHSALRNHETGRQRALTALLDGTQGTLDRLLLDAERELESLVRSLEAQQVDPLTGLPSHERLLSQVGKSCLLALREGHALSLVAIDIDQLGAINEARGESAGDQTLCAVASRVTRAIRSTDFAARGLRDCFFVVLPGTTLQQAAGIAEKICRAMEESGTEYPAPCTVSCGVACYWEYDTPPHLVQRALQAMARARSAGGNCVRRADET